MRAVPLFQRNGRLHVLTLRRSLERPREDSLLSGRRRRLWPGKQLLQGDDLRQLRQALRILSDPFGSFWILLNPILRLLARS